ncbi:GAF domain-containing protein [Olivibacter sp. XZL3]|uniref:GAF domain-containing protein n=1 Tax=Olivibacter sp. XZL3 TaxID=1735116 RepID=UPI001066403E|nr:GAF domain-containing protein [Olivibacter sp. XZL3]
MFTQVLDLSENKKDLLGKLDIQLSIDGFIEHLRKLAGAEDNAKHEMLEFLLHKFVEARAVYGPLTEENLNDYSRVLFYVYNLLVPPLEDEREMLWALATPLGKNVFYGTTGFYNLIRQEFCEETFNDIKESKHKHELIEQSIYSLLLERFYEIPPFEDEVMEFSSKDQTTNLRRYYAVQIDKRFVEIKPKITLPELDYKKIRQSNVQQFEWKFLREMLPLNQFAFTGFSIITVKEVTPDRVMQNIRDIVSRNSDDEIEQAYDILEESLRTLTGNHHIKFGLSPILQLNNKPILDQVYMHGSILPDLLKKKTPHCQEANLTESYLLNPQIIVYNIGIEFGDPNFKFLNDLSDLGLTSYVCIPLYYNSAVIGLLEVYTNDGHMVDKIALAKLRRAAPLLAQLLYDQANRFNARIDAIIKEKFTSLQPAVQWKFNEAAYEYLKKVVPQKPKPTIENIQFKNVYPLYGAIDIRNSTIERNKALVADYKTQLGLLKQVLQEIKSIYSIAILDEMEFNCDKWLMQLDASPIDVVQMKVKDFMEKEVYMLLMHFKNSHSALTEIIEKYEQEIVEETGKAYQHRRALESSIATINTAVNGYLELLNDEIQRSYPCYFEKFRTDGVEYDIYIGQSIAPEKPFDVLYLKNVRLWQLTSMASIAKITHTLLQQMETPLETTQLIFINGNDIDISFRVDERRFDVEGAYNIRYHIIKKRIDKVHLKDSYERLTQPGKIALVYYDAREIKEYIGYINYLQNKDILLDDMEELELEELQGVSGLKAIRIGVKC